MTASQAPARIAEALRSEAAISARPGQCARLEALADQIAALPDLEQAVREARAEVWIASGAHTFSCYEDCARTPCLGELCPNSDANLAAERIVREARP